MLLRSRLLMPLLVIGVAFFGWFLHRKKGDFEYSGITDKSGVEASITVEQSKFYARDIFNAMNKLGTDVDKISHVAFNVNIEDWRLIHNAFGSKKYFAIGKGTHFGEWKDMKEWLQAELGVFNKKLKSRISDLYKGVGVIF